MSDKREWTAERHAAAKDLGSLSGAGKQDALAEIERLREQIAAAHKALDVEIGRGDKATGHVYSLAERINFVIGGLRDEARRGDEAEDKADRLTQRLATETARANLIATHRKIACSDLDKMTKEAASLKADLLLLGALKSAEVAPVIERFREAFGADVPQAPSGKRALTRDRAREIGLRAMSPAPGRIPEGIVDQVEDAILRAAAGEFGAPCDPAKVDPPVRHARHDRHCMIGDGVGCSHEPGCEVEP